MAKKPKKKKQKNEQVALFPQIIKCANCGKETDNPVKEMYCSQECHDYLPF